MPRENENLEMEQEIEQTEEQEETSSLFEWTRALVGAVLGVVLFFVFVAQVITVQGPSMQNTLYAGDKVLVLKSALCDIEAGDVVMVHQYNAQLNETIIKRVIATGGQTVDIDYTTGAVYVDGEALDEPYIREEMYRPYVSTMQQTHWEVPEGSIFVMGDNRNASTDSRDDRLGTIDEDYVLGKVVLGLWPPSRVGTM